MGKCVVVILFFIFLFCFVFKNKYKEKYANNMKSHYEGIDKKTMHAMKARKLASDVSLTRD